ncbi:hypothetical protein [Pseudomonas phage PAXYB1]|uniref:Uncharacterized protein n=3 Tax=Phikmvvirus TaxID=477967 RepID=A0A9E7TX16_9CAUD|nr:hypothetical protein HOT06_gp10 [Pseudomonas phage PAXYB1]UGL61475.1 hypothetical protein [Pseudomonas phage phipa2]UKH49125.1 hypothetical protein vBPaeS1_09 [Pseudomonas phage vB_Pae_S1]UVN13037.1 hypothetical protein FBPa3_0007 [Pseudomonas phage vB_PaeM_FBPa3]UVN13160.1 hypothetical protein FBPa6_0006 [Pseudomonas phage vB_PaeP_FBPa6]UVN13537.1 hypothetical protein FBPa18_0008 [Pseudomonas phage vB_PaeP_FBPa18]UVN13706.1 hypothetical protein FBPa25_0009 [Pseudomonas phage vB_PaeP_FBPa2
MTWLIIAVSPSGGCAFVWSRKRPVRPLRFYSRKAAKRWLRKHRRSALLGSRFLIVNWSKRI